MTRSTLRILKELTLLQNLSLDIEFAKTLTSQGIEALASGIKTLKNLSGLTLSIKNNPKFDNKTIEIYANMLQSLPGLYSVDFNLMACPNMTFFYSLFQELKKENIGEISIQLSKQVEIPKESIYLKNNKIVKKMEKAM